MAKKAKTKSNTPSRARKVSAKARSAAPATPRHIVFKPKPGTYSIEGGKANLAQNRRIKLETVVMGGGNGGKPKKRRGRRPNMTKDQETQALVFMRNNPQLEGQGQALLAAIRKAAGIGKEILDGCIIRLIEKSKQK